MSIRIRNIPLGLLLHPDLLENGMQDDKSWNMLALGMDSFGDVGKNVQRASYILYSLCGNLK